MTGTAETLTILHVVAPARVGGLEQVVINLAGGHVAAGHQVHVAVILTSEDPAHPFVTSLRDAGVGVHVAIIGARSYTRERNFIAQLCAQLEPDVVHTHGYRPDVIDSGIVRRLGIPIVSTVHGFIRGNWRGRCYEWLQRRWLRYFDAVVAVSRPQVEELAAAGVPRARLHLLRNAWTGVAPPLQPGAARARLGVADDVFHVGYVGRLTREKGPDVLIDALAHLKDLPLVVSFIGSGRDAELLKQHAAQHTRADIRWHGMIPDARLLYPAFDVFVLSSRTEGTPIALFEAMAAGVPVVTTAVGGVPDVVSGEEALLVPSEDPAALAAAIRHIYQDRAGADTRALAAHARLHRDFDLEPWLSAYEMLYRQLRSPRVALEVAV